MVLTEQDYSKIVEEQLGKIDFILCQKGYSRGDWEVEEEITSLEMLLGKCPFPEFENSKLFQRVRKYLSD